MAAKGNENLLAAASYLLGFVTGIIILLVEKQNKFVRFHAMQSVVLFGGATILHLVLMFTIVGLFLIPFLLIVEFVVWILLMWKAFNGEEYKIPFVGDFAEKQLRKFN